MFVNGKLQIKQPTTGASKGALASKIGKEKAEMTMPVVTKVQNSFKADDVVISFEKRREINVGTGDSSQNKTTKNGYQLLEEEK